MPMWSIRPNASGGFRLIYRADRRGTALSIRVSGTVETSHELLKWIAGKGEAAPGDVIEMPTGEQFVWALESASA